MFPDERSNWMSDIVAATWSELMDALYEIPKTEIQRFRSNLVYRGVGCAAWNLDTSLCRLRGDYTNIEQPMLRSFGKYAESGSIPAETLWVRLAVAQHHGLPTRLLDWTLSPRVAIHFATAQEEHLDEDGAIWCVDAAAARELLPQCLKEILLFFEPPSLDSRIVNQAAIMSVMPGATLRLHEFLSDHPELWRRIIIPKELKWEVRDKLDQDNVTERMLFPGLDGLSRWLKRYYGPGPLRRRSVPGDE